jgi:DNA-binding MarR family transcriptional regulator
MSSVKLQGRSRDARGTESASRLLSVDLTREIPFLAARARALTSRSANAELRGVGLNVRSFSVLSLACSGAGPSQRELGLLLQLDPSQVVGLIHELQERRAVVREADPGDRRSNIIVATPAGHELHEQAARLLAAATARSLAGLTPAEQDVLRGLLHKLCFPDARIDLPDL